MNDVTGSELDIALIAALQMRPRADWVELAAPLRRTPKTLGRRWRELTEHGLAWISLVPGQAYVRYGCAVFVLVGCRPQDRERVIAALVGVPEIVSLSATSGGGADFLLDLFAPTLEVVTRTLEAHVFPVEGITSVRTLVGLTTFREGSRWRVQALDLEQSLLLSRPAGGTRRSVPDLSDLDRRLLEGLATDARLPWTDLAQRCDTTGPTARRRVERMLGSGRLALRCEAAPPLIGPIVSTTFLLEVRPDEVNRVGESLGRLPRCRVVEAITGPANMLLTMWFRSTAEIAPFEAALARELGSVRVADRFVSLRTHKRGGRILDSAGRAVDAVPLTSIFGA